MKLWEQSELDCSEKELIVDVPVMLKNKVLKILDKCHMQNKLILWGDLEDALMFDPFWLRKDRAKSTIAWARKETPHEEFRCTT